MEGQPGPPYQPQPPYPEKLTRKSESPRLFRTGAFGVVLGGTALLALLVAVAALGIALTALGRTDGARRDATAAAGGAQPAPGGGNANPGGGGTPADTSPAPATGSVQPTAVYTVFYQRQQLRMPRGVFPADDDIDLDEPRVSADQTRAEFSLNGDGAIVSSVSRAEVSSPDASAQDCAQAIRTAPLNRDVTAAAGLNLCLQTDLAVATAEGHPQRLFLLSVDSVAKDGTVNVTVTAWNVPK